MKHTEDWFRERIEEIPYSLELKAYVVGVLNRFVTQPFELPRGSVVLAYADARFSGDFVKFQQLGDWILWQRSFVPTRDNVELIERVGKESYQTCHVLLHGQWRVYDELSQQLSSVASSVNSKITLRV